MDRAHRAALIGAPLSSPKRSESVTQVMAFLNLHPRILQWVRENPGTVSERRSRSLMRLTLRRQEVLESPRGSRANAGAYYFEDRSDLAQLHEVDWTAVEAQDWRGHKEGKQAEFLLERRFPWSLVRRVGVQSVATRTKVLASMQQAAHQPPVQRIPAWYY